MLLFLRPTHLGTFFADVLQKLYHTSFVTLKMLQSRSLLGSDRETITRCAGREGLKFSESSATLLMR